MPPTATAARHPITLGGKTYLMSPLSDRDIDELENWLRSTVIKMAKRCIEPGSSQHERDEIIGAAIREARKLTWTGGDGARIMSSAEGICAMIWQSLRKNHPELTLEDVRSMILDEAGRLTEQGASDAAEMMGVWKEINIGGTRRDGAAGGRRVGERNQGQALDRRRRRSSTRDSRRSTSSRRRRSQS